MIVAAVIVITDITDITKTGRRSQCGGSCEPSVVGLLLFVDLL